MTADSCPHLVGQATLLLRLVEVLSGCEEDYQLISRAGDLLQQIHTHDSFKCLGWNKELLLLMTTRKLYHQWIVSFQPFVFLPTCTAAPRSRP